MNKQHRKQGSITVFFLLFVLVAAGAISYSIYIGRTTVEKIKTNQAADAAAFAMTAHATQGLNMMAANNLAIGAAIHIAAAAPIIARYYAIGQALAVTFPSSLNDIRKMEMNPDNSTFAKGFSIMAHASGHYMKTASALTAMNETIAKYWILSGIPKGLEVMRLNRPGSIGLPLQVNHPMPHQSPIDLFHHRYGTLRQTKPQDTICHAIKSSEGLGARNLSVAWLRGPIDSFRGPSALQGVLNVIEGIENFVQSTIGQVRTKTEEVLDAVDKVRDKLPCNAKYPPLACSVANRIKKNIEAIIPPVPGFYQCGLNDQGNFGLQVEAFGKNKTFNQSIGFLYPHVTNAGELKDFSDSLSFAMVVGNPTLKEDELPQSAAGHATCPQQWTYQLDGITRCSVPLGGLTFGDKTADNPLDGEASGGLAYAAGHGLANPWKRVQWSAGQARAVYRPDGASGDPTINDTSPLAPQSLEVLNKTRMQLFWPAWQAEMTPVTIWDEITRFITGQS